MQVRLIPEGLIVDAFPAVSGLNNLLIKYSNPVVIKERGRRWDSRSQGTYEIISVADYEKRFIK